MVATALAEPTVWHVRHLRPSGGEQLQAGQRALVKRARTPVLRERLLCGAQQVSAGHLSPPPQQNTL